MAPGANSPRPATDLGADLKVASVAGDVSSEAEGDLSLSEVVARALDSVSPTITVATWASSSDDEEVEVEKGEVLEAAGRYFSSAHATVRPSQMLFGPALLKRRRRQQRLRCYRGRVRVRRLCAALGELWLVALWLAWASARAGVRCAARALPLCGRCAARALARPLALAQLLLLGGAALAARALDPARRLLRSPTQACASAALTACAPAALCFLCARAACSCACACACDLPARACGAVGLGACACVELCVCDAPAAVCALPERFALYALRDARRLLHEYAPRWPPAPRCPCAGRPARGDASRRPGGGVP